MAKSPKKYLIEDSIMIDEIYPIIEQSAKAGKINSVKSCIQKFIQTRHKELYDYAPVDRIYFRKQDVNDFFRAINIKENSITPIIQKLYYYNKDELQACKDEFSLTCLMLLRYLLKNKASDKAIIELVYMYLSFSGKFYASCHAAWFRHYIPKREVMDYVVNYMLSQKFDLAKTGSVWGAIKSLTSTWVDSYKEELCGDITDERIVYLIHQLHNRIYAFLRNIAKLYYEAYEKKLYLNAESDNYNEDKYRIAHNNSTIISNITEKTMIYFTTTQINIAICYNCAGSGVDPYELKAIFENILNDNKSIDDLRTVISILLADFLKKYPEEKDLTGLKFIDHSIAMKPNTKDKDILQLKNIILNWLNNSARYRSIKTQATKNNYYKGILSYIAITVNRANKE